MSKNKAASINTIQDLRKHLKVDALPKRPTHHHAVFMFRLSLMSQIREVLTRINRTASQREIASVLAVSSGTIANILHLRVRGTSIEMLVYLADNLAIEYNLRTMHMISEAGIEEFISKNTRNRELIQQLTH